MLPTIYVVTVYVRYSIVETELFTDRNEAIRCYNSYSNVDCNTVLSEIKRSVDKEGGCNADERRLSDVSSRLAYTTDTGVETEYYHEYYDGRTVVHVPELGKVNVEPFGIDGVRVVIDGNKDESNAIELYPLLNGKFGTLEGSIVQGKKHEFEAGTMHKAIEDAIDLLRIDWKESNFKKEVADFVYTGNELD